MKSQATEWGWSRYETYLQCPRKYYYSYINREESFNFIIPAQTLGSFTHLLLQKELKPRSVTSKVLQAAKCELSDIDVLTGYNLVEKWRRLKLPIKKVLSVEKECKATFGDAEYTCRHDVIVELTRKGLWAIDYKTSSIVTDSFLQSWHTSGSVIGQYILARQNHPELKGVIIVVLPKAKSRPAAIPIYCVPSERQIEDFKELIGNTDFDIKSSFYNPSFKCQTQYGLCQHQDRCLGEKRCLTKSV